MIKDAEDKGLITPGKVGSEISTYLGFFFFFGHTGFLPFKFSSFLVDYKHWNQIKYIPTIAMMAPAWLFIRHLVHILLHTVLIFNLIMT